MRYCSVDPTVIYFSVIDVNTWWVSSLQNIQRICSFLCFVFGKKKSNNTSLSLSLVSTLIVVVFKTKRKAPWALKSLPIIKICLGSLKLQEQSPRSGHYSKLCDISFHYQINMGGSRD